MILSTHNPDHTLHYCCATSIVYPFGTIRRVSVGSPTCLACPCCKHEHYDDNHNLTGIECNFNELINQKKQ